MSTTQRLLDAQGIPSTSFVDLVGGSDAILPDAAGLVRAPGTAVSDPEQTIDNQLGNVGSNNPLGVPRDPYGNVEPDGDELTDPQELSELPSPQGLVHQLSDGTHGSAAQIANSVAAQVAAAASSVGGICGAPHAVGDTVGQAIDSAAHSISQAVATSPDALANNLVQDASGDLLNGGPVQELLNGQPDHLSGTVTQGPLVDANILPNGVLGSSGIFHSDIDPSQGSLISVDALAAPHGMGSHIVEVDALPRSLGDIGNVSALTSPESGDGAIGAIVGNGPSLIDVNALTGSTPNVCAAVQGVGNLLQGIGCGPDGVLGALDAFGPIADANVIPDGLFGSPGIAQAMIDPAQASLVTLDILAADNSPSSHIVDADALPRSLGQIANVSALTAPAAGEGAIGVSIGNSPPSLLDANALTGADQIHLPNLGGMGVDALQGVLAHDVGGFTQAAIAPIADLPGTVTGVGGPSCTAVPAVDIHDVIQQATGTTQHVDLHCLL